MTKAVQEKELQIQDNRNPDAPIETYLRILHQKLSGVKAGDVASYIPELSRANPDWFGISIATVDGKVYNIGDTDQSFTIQSVSKPFMYGYALREYDLSFVLEHVGVEPTGEAFNSVVLDEINNRPFNPMVNAGAIAVAELVKGELAAERLGNMRRVFEQFVGHELTIDQATYLSEKKTGHRNRGIAYMMLNSGMIKRDPEEILDLYFQQCSINVTASDLAMMAATLANDGVQPLTKETVLGPDDVRNVLTVMNTCGMYNYAGQWAYEVGVPAKSGVSGSVISVIPGQVGICVFSPPLDNYGNSVRGILACKEISENFNLHVFNNRTNVRSVIRREYNTTSVRSKRMRTPEERSYLDIEGSAICVIELQGALYFGSVEQLTSKVWRIIKHSEYLIIDFKRVHHADDAAVRLIHHMVEAVGDTECKLVLSNLAQNTDLTLLHSNISPLSDTHDVNLSPNLDLALEYCENRFLATKFPLSEQMTYALKDISFFNGLTAAELKLIEGIIRPFQFEKGDVILRAGDPANIFFVLAKGTVSVSVASSDGLEKRIACIGPGVTFGEMALLDGGKRSANVIADNRVICYGLSVEQIKKLKE